MQYFVRLEVAIFETSVCITDKTGKIVFEEKKLPIHAINGYLKSKKLKFKMISIKDGSSDKCVPRFMKMV